MHGPLSNEKPPRRERNPAMYDLSELAETIVPLLDAATGVLWYEEGNAADEAVDALCMLRRAAAGAGGGGDAGDAAVRDALGRAAPGSVLWLATRAVSYMDEHGFPEERDETRGRASGRL